MEVNAKDEDRVHWIEHGGFEQNPFYPTITYFLGSYDINYDSVFKNNLWFCFIFPLNSGFMI
ncbi:MAG: hypothetical protein A7315_03615 [Candidatus Altiarchaeales archaeon WOR_SM1_79]|nr:MAG: hypothetical protein A7315_03615 [Candidatus Altiarchaeales archaeon WOR_SM1_79]